MRFKNFINSFNKRNRIFSEEDLLKMQLANLLDNEDAIIAQNTSIGIPNYSELQQSPNVQWVGDYINQQGQKDGGYWQSILTPDYQESFAPQFKLGHERMENNPTIIKSKPKNLLTPLLKGQKEENIEIPEEKIPMLEGHVDYNEIPMLDDLKNSIHNGINTAKEKVDNIKKTINKTQSKYEGLSAGAQAQKAASKFPYMWNTDGQYYGMSTRLADGDELTRDMKESNDFKKIGDIKDEKLQKEYIKKAAEMYKLDTNDPNLKEKVKDTQVIIPKSDSKLNRQVKESPAFQEWVAKNYNDIKSGKLENEKSSLEFPFGIIGDKRGLFGTIHNTDLINSKVNSDGSLTTTYSDGYDFDKMEKNEKDSGYKKTVVNVNNNAYEQQEKEKLQRSLLTSSIRLTKEEVEEILKKYYGIK